MDDVRNQCFSETSLDCLGACRRSPLAQRSGSDNSPPKYPAAPHPSPVHTQDRSERGSRFHLQFHRAFPSIGKGYDGEPSDSKSGYGDAFSPKSDGDRNESSNGAHSSACGETSDYDGDKNEPSEIVSINTCGETGGYDLDRNKPLEIGREKRGNVGNRNEPSGYCKSSSCEFSREMSGYDEDRNDPSVEVLNSQLERFVFEKTPSKRVDDCEPWNVISPRKPKSPVAEFLSWRKNKPRRGKVFSGADLERPRKNKNKDLDFLNTI